jgi:hypothetical protein
MWPCQPSAHGGFELAVTVAAEIDRHPADSEELGDPVDRGLERVRDGQLRRCLRNHLE